MYRYTGTTVGVRRARASRNSKKVLKKKYIIIYNTYYVYIIWFLTSVRPHTPKHTRPRTQVYTRTRHSRHTHTHARAPHADGDRPPRPPAIWCWDAAPWTRLRDTVMAQWTVHAFLAAAYCCCLVAALPSLQPAAGMTVGLAAADTSAGAAVPSPSSAARNRRWSTTFGANSSNKNVTGERDLRSHAGMCAMLYHGLSWPWCIRLTWLIRLCGLTMTFDCHKL